MNQLLIAKVFIKNQSGKYLLLRRSIDDDHRPGGSDLPGGHLDPHETFEYAAVRECREEAGVELNHDDIRLFYTDTGSDQRGLTIKLYFVATIADDIAIVLSKEHDAYEWLDAADFATKLESSSQIAAFSYATEHGLF